MSKTMFVEGEIEIKSKDRTTIGMDEHDLKLWMQRSFKDMCCYRIAGFESEGGKLLKATVALKTSVLPDSDRELLEGHPNDVGALRTFMEKMFEGKGTCRCVGHPKLRAN